jgi:DNA-directed RNA polymerase
MTVHDSFSVHAGNVEIMRRVLAETFVELHSHPIIENLEAFVASELGEDAPETVERGNFDLGLVYGAEYLFS